MKNNWEKEFDEKFSAYCLGETLGWEEFNRKKIKSFIYQLVKQTREECAQIAEGKKIDIDHRDYVYRCTKDNDQRWYDKGQNDVCDDIAKAIRGK